MKKVQSYLKEEEVQILMSNQTSKKLERMKL